jgi:hypothetical protein
MSILKRLLPKKKSEQKKKQATVDSCESALRFQKDNPPGSLVPMLTPKDQQELYDQGIFAWQFVPQKESQVSIHDGTRLVFPPKEVCCQTNYPVYLQNNVLGYFEVTIRHKSPEVVVGVGLATKPYPFWRFPGWNLHSVGYHSDDGCKFWNDDGQGQEYGKSFGIGDTVGCGWLPAEGKVYFTLNGEYLGIAYAEVETAHFYFPTVAADGNAIVEVNLGRKPFQYSQANLSFANGILYIVPASLPPPPPPFEAEP